MRETFGADPVTFRNTELIYSNEVAAAAESMGFKVVLAEGADAPLAGRGPDRIYTPKGSGGIVALLKNYRLSDDIAFRFSSDDWKEFPLSPEKFAGWIRRAGSRGEVVNLFMDYETMGEHQRAESGIFRFFESLPAEILRLPDFRFLTPSQAASEFETAGELDVADLTSWADVDRDLSAWNGNELQGSALEAVYEMEDQVLAAGDEAIETWRRLQTSDHFYYMCTKWFADGDVHKYFNPYLSPYDAYVNYMNVLSDFREDLEHG
jgi:alpha-amylase